MAGTETVTKYQLARTQLSASCEKAEANQIELEDFLLANLVTAIERYQEKAGRKAAIEALRYELDNLGDGLDLVHLRAR